MQSFSIKYECGVKEMSNMKNESGSEGLGEKNAYEPPRAMRLEEMRNGAGDCVQTGSGDSRMCASNGNSPGLDCLFVGHSD
jgi:hypothetical protein